MKNYIIFYAAIILFVIGGIKLTSYVIEKEKKEELAKINFHKNVSALLVSGGEVSSSELMNKNIVLYLGFTGDERNQSDFLKLNELKNKYAGNSVVYLFCRANKEYMEGYFKKLKVEPAFKPVYKPMQLPNYIMGLNRYFYTAEQLNEIKIRNPHVIVISNAGKIKLYKIGYEKDLHQQVENALKQ